MIKIEREDRCCGCGSCVNACPKECITMVELADGFRYPVVDETKCIDCGLCEKVCPYLNLTVKNDILQQPDIYTTRSKNDEVLETSATGGLFYELAKFVIEQGGIAFGAVWGNNYDEVYHRSIMNLSDLPLLQGSKYLQSNMGFCYHEAKRYLNQGKLVIFSGTPCQIAGLLTYLGSKTYDNLLTCDVICHGVPTPVALRRFLTDKEKETGKKVVKYFRDKKLGWKPAVFRILYDDGTSEVIPHGQNHLNELFTTQLAIVRNSCYGCRFERLPRIADISLGDYFVQKNAKDMEGNEVKIHDNKGLSLISVNTKQGEKFYKMIQSRVEYNKLQNQTVSSWHLFQGPGKASDPMSRRMFYYFYNKGYSIDKIYEAMYGTKIIDKIQRKIFKIFQ